MEEATVRAPAGALVRLNVGGEIFATTRTTLLGSGATRNFFTGLLSMGSTLDESGAYFIDRDPGAFRYILNFMRSGSLLAPSPPYTMAQLRAEAQYFGIELPGAGAAAADGGAVAEAEPQGDMLVLHVFGGATTNNFVKAVQLDIYGPLSKSCSNRIAALLDTFDIRQKNVFELPVVKCAPTMHAVVMCSCLDLGIVHQVCAILSAYGGWRVTSHSDSCIPDVQHQKTQSTYIRRDFVFTFAPK